MSRDFLCGEVRAIPPSYPPQDNGFGLAVLGNWPILGRKREQNEQKWRLLYTSELDCSPLVGLM